MHNLFVSVSAQSNNNLSEVKKIQEYTKQLAYADLIIYVHYCNSISIYDGKYIRTVNKIRRTFFRFVLKEFDSMKCVEKDKI